MDHQIRGENEDVAQQLGIKARIPQKFKNLIQCYPLISIESAQKRKN
jgi:hypothetical protein